MSPNHKQVELSLTYCAIFYAGEKLWPSAASCAPVPTRRKRSKWNAPCRRVLRQCLQRSDVFYRQKVMKTLAIERVPNTIPKPLCQSAVFSLPLWYSTRFNSSDFYPSTHGTTRTTSIWFFTRSNAQNFLTRCTNKLIPQKRVTTLCLSQKYLSVVEIMWSLMVHSAQTSVEMKKVVRDVSCYIPGLSTTQ